MFGNHLRASFFVSLSHLQFSRIKFPDVEEAVQLSEFPSVVISDLSPDTLQIDGVSLRGKPI